MNSFTIFARTGALSLTVAAAAGIAAAALHAQSAPPAGQPKFAVASVKPNKSLDRSGPFGLQPGGRFVATNATLTFLVRFAYEPSPFNRALEPFQVSGGPEWVRSARFDVDARGAANTTLAQARLMVQALLAERFGLKVHRDTTDLPVYRLVLSRRDGTLGPQLRRTTLTCAQPPDPFARQGINEPVACGYFGLSPGLDPATGRSLQAFRGLSMDALAAQLRSFLGRSVVNETGLTGYYDGDFELTAEIAIPPPPPGVANPFAGRVFPSIFSVLPDQLGLRLESSRGAVDVLVIDDAQQPTEN